MPLWVLESKTPAPTRGSNVPAGEGRCNGWDRACCCCAEQNRPLKPLLLGPRWPLLLPFPALLAMFFRMLLFCCLSFSMCSCKALKVQGGVPQKHLSLGVFFL